MSIEVVQTSEDKIWVNDTLVIKDMNNNWIANKELYPAEQTALNDWLRQIGEI